MVAVPEYSLVLLPPTDIEFDLMSASLQGGRSLSGLYSSVNISGGPVWTVTYRKLQLWKPDSHLYYQKLRNILSGGVRSIVVPFLNDYVVPLPPGQVLGAPTSRFSDLSLFSDSSQFTQDQITATASGAYVANAGTFSFLAPTGVTFIGGETFSINHPTLSFRAYGITDIDSSADQGTGNTLWTVGVTPPIRDVVADKTPLEFVRPKCVMKLAADGKMPWNPRIPWVAQPDVTFVEALPFYGT